MNILGKNTPAELKFNADATTFQCDAKGTGELLMHVVDNSDTSPTTSE